MVDELERLCSRLTNPFEIRRQLPNVSPARIGATALLLINRVDRDLEGRASGMGDNGGHSNPLHWECNHRHWLFGYTDAPQTDADGRQHLARWTIQIEAGTLPLGSLAGIPDSSRLFLSDVVNQRGSPMLSGDGLELAKTTIASVGTALLEHLLRPSLAAYIELARQRIDTEATGAFMDDGGRRAAALDKQLAALKATAAAAADLRLETLQRSAEEGDPRSFHTLIEVAEGFPLALPMDSRELRAALAMAIVTSNPERFCKDFRWWPFDRPEWQGGPTAAREENIRGPAQNTMSTPGAYKDRG